MRGGALFAALALSAIVALAGCAQTPQAQLTADVQAISVGVDGVVVALYAADPNIPASTQASINAAVAAVQGDAEAIAQSLSPATAPIGAFVNSVQVLAGLVQPYYANAPRVATLMVAVSSLVQTILQETGGAVAFVATPVAAPPMSATVARATLQQTH